jgi:hypothetical protein
MTRVRLAQVLVPALEILAAAVVAVVRVVRAALASSLQG